MPLPDRPHLPAVPAHRPYHGYVLWILRRTAGRQQSRERHAGKILVLTCDGVPVARSVPLDGNNPNTVQYKQAGALLALLVDSDLWSAHGRKLSYHICQTTKGARSPGKTGGKGATQSPAQAAGGRSRDHGVETQGPGRYLRCGWSAGRI